MPDPPEAGHTFATHANPAQQRGAVFTHDHVVQRILDLCHYDAAGDLTKTRLLEPSCGNGQFLVAALERLLASSSRHGYPPQNWVSYLGPCLRAVEIHPPTVTRTRARVIGVLQSAGLSSTDAHKLASTWIVQGDFLLTPLDGPFDLVVGNPPYVRQERIPRELLAEYRTRYTTLYDRADLYIAFFERSLDYLQDRGVVGFICANRWIKNKYGGPLRAKIAANYNLDLYIDMAGANAFEQAVEAYPAITIIRRAPTSKTAIIRDFDGDTPNDSHTSTPATVWVRNIACARDPWLVDTPEIIPTVRDLEARFPTLEQAGARVGIGVATGADRIYIRPIDELPVEPTRKLPLALSGDLKPTGIAWSGHGLLNPYLADGRLAALEDYPQFATYLRAHEAALKQRHTAKKSPNAWYKTIDRVYPKLTRTPKLLIPDIKGEATVLYDPGEYYPHHNLYVVTSKIWDLQVLQAILKSSVSLMFVAAYCVRMAGGFLRFQAQYLRRIRVPKWDSLSAKQRRELAAVASGVDLQAIDRVVFPAFGIRPPTARTIRAFAHSARTRPRSRGRTDTRD